MRVRDAGSDGGGVGGGLLGRAAAGSTGSVGSVGSVGSSGAETTYELPDGQTLQIGEEVREFSVASSYVPRYTEKYKVSP